MHNLIALSLALPGTPLHGLNDFEPRSRSTAPPMRAARASTPSARHKRTQVAGKARPALGASTIPDRH